MGVGARRQPTRETPAQRQSRTELARQTKLANDARRQTDPEAAADWILAQAARVAPLGPEQTRRVTAALTLRASGRASRMTLPATRRSS